MLKIVPKFPSYPSAGPGFHHNENKKSPSSVSLHLAGSEPLVGSCLISVKFGLIIEEFTPLCPLCSRLKMTTATPLTNNTQLSENVTTKSQEQILYQSKERSGVVAFFGFKWTLNLSNFKHYSDNFVNMAFFPFLLLSQVLEQ